MSKIYIETHGCQMNDADSQDIARRAIASGYALVEKPEDASVLVLNTCTVRDNAEQRAYGRIGQWKALKRADPAVKIVVAGCLAEQDKAQMPGAVSHVDAVFGTKELRALGDQLAAWRPDFGALDAGFDESREARALIEPMGGVGAGIPGPYDVVRAFVNVQRGCSYYCTFCIVPHVRGRFDHRPAGEIVAEVREKIARGAREVTLVGQTVNAYREPATGADFADLLEIVAAIDGVERITFVTSHPKDITEKLARTVAALPKVNERLMVALQSASDPVLRRMNRKYTIAQFDAALTMWRSYNPHLAVATDMMVGFPGETDEDAQRTIDYAATGVFAQAYTFVYSPRRGTPASKWDQVDPDVARERFRKLVAAQDAATLAHNERKVGTVVRTLIRGRSKRHPETMSSKTTDNVTVNFPEIETVDRPDTSRPWVDVRIDGASVWGVKGVAVGRAARYDAPAEPVAAPLIDLLALESLA